MAGVKEERQAAYRAKPFWIHNPECFDDWKVGEGDRCNQLDSDPKCGYVYWKEDVERERAETQAHLQQYDKTLDAAMQSLDKSEKKLAGLNKWHYLMFREQDKPLQKQWEQRNMPLICGRVNEKCKKHPNRLWCASWQGYLARAEDEAMLKQRIDEAEARVKELEAQYADFLDSLLSWSADEMVEMSERDLRGILMGLRRRAEAEKAGLKKI